MIVEKDDQLGALGIAPNSLILELYTHWRAR